MDPFGLALGLGVRASVLLGFTALALLALRRAAASTRQGVAVAGMTGALALLLPLSLALPTWDVAVFPVAESVTSGVAWVALAWGVVAALFLARLAVGMWRIARCVRGGTELPGDEVARAARKLGLRNPPRVVLSREAKVPMTAGLREPAVILPAEAAGWSSERLELVLLHELAHVKRRDWLAVLVAEISVAWWWFHPLAWLARRSIRRDAELAADELVLRTGARPSVYADHLLAIVRSLRDARQFGLRMTIGRSSDLDGRLRALLERRRRGPSSRWGLAIAAALGGLALVLASLQPTHASVQQFLCPLSAEAGSRSLEGP